MLVALKIWWCDDETNEEFLGVFSSLELLEQAVDELDFDSCRGSTIGYYSAVLDAPDDAPEWVVVREIPEYTEEELAESKRHSEEWQKNYEERIRQNRLDFLRNS